MDQRKVEKTRELIDRGFYDDPEILELLFEHCVRTILCGLSRSRAKGTPAHVSSEPLRRCSGCAVVQLR